MEILQQPSGIGLTRSPLLYLVTDPNNANEGFQYVANVKIWKGDVTAVPVDPTYVLYRPPLSDGSAIFDLSQLASGLFTEHLLTSDGGWMIIDFTFIDSIGTTPTTVTSSVDGILNGFTYIPQGVNATGYQPIATDRNPLNTYIPSEYPFTVPIRMAGSTIVDRVHIENDRGQHQTVMLSTLGTYTESDSILVDFPCGTDQLVGWGMDADSQYYYIQAQSSGGAVGDRFWFRVQEICLDQLKKIQFINKYGGIDSILFRGNGSESMTIQSELIERSILQSDGSALSYANSPQIAAHHITGQENITLNTGWVDELDNELMKQLFLSQVIWDQDGDQFLNIQEKQILFKRMPVTKLVNYTVVFSVANTVINNIN